MSEKETQDDLMRRIKALSERLWEGLCQAPDIEAWLGNFDGRHCGHPGVERLHALHLLASTSYFGLRELRVLLRAMYRDLFRYPIIQAIRAEAEGVVNLERIHERFEAELSRTRFVGMGNPAESGTHLLYYYRQENRLGRHLFVNQHDLLTGAATEPEALITPPDLRRVVFIDDLCGSGEQSIRYSRTLLQDLKNVAKRSGRKVTFIYHVLFGTANGLSRARELSTFDEVNAVNSLDETYCTFSPTSRVLRKPPAGIDGDISEQLAKGYGMELWPRWPLGYQDGQLLLGFHHNVPNNTLPILWSDEYESSWIPILPRYRKSE